MTVVLDASALLALLHNETGADIVEEALLNKAVISTVNWTEVIQKTIAKNISIVGWVAAFWQPNIQHKSNIIVGFVGLAIASPTYQLIHL